MLSNNRCVCWGKFTVIHEGDLTRKKEHSEISMKSWWFTPLGSMILAVSGAMSTLAEINQFNLLDREQAHTLVWFV